MSFKERLLEKFHNKPLISAIITSFSTRTLVLSALAFAINIAFALFNGIASLIYKSMWHGSLAIYYFFLSFMRLAIILIFFSLRRKHREDPDRMAFEKEKIYLFNGLLILLLAIALTAVNIEVIFSTRPAIAGEIFAIALATYSFYKITIAIINSARARRTTDAITKTIRNIGLVDAVVSMLMLTNTLITTFGSAVDMRLMLVFASVASSITNISVGSFMIIQGITNIMKYKRR